VNSAVATTVQCNAVRLNAKKLAFDIHKIRNDFPVLRQEIHNRPLVYFDNAATTQKPVQVIERMNSIYRETNSNIHRGVHYLSDLTTNHFEQARATMGKFINARHDHEIIFTPGTTAGINLMAFSFGERFVGQGDEIIISAIEHHANIVPWQMLCERKGARLKVIPVNDNGELLLEDFEKLLSAQTRIVAITHVANSIGTINPVKKMIEMAHRYNVPVLVDGAQAVQHGKVDVQDLDADFYTFSGHKMYGPTGIGVLYGKENFLDQMPPYQTGGEMVDKVTFEKTTFNKLPFKFEAGTPNYIGAIGLATAADYLQETGLEDISAWEKDLLDYGNRRLTEIEGLHLFGEADNKISIMSFILDDIHPYDAGMIIDKYGIAVRTGNHCAQPFMERLGIRGTVRASMVFYNTREEIDRLCEAIQKVQEMFN
jgi:cysteine desulfurase / selenocysteine lyase